jgi:hypothetical protein
VIFAKETLASVLSVVQKNLYRWATLVDRLRFLLDLEIEKMPHIQPPSTGH